MWEHVLQQSNEILEAILMFLPIKTLMVLRTKSQRLYKCTQKPLYMKEQAARYGFQSYNERAFEPYCKDEFGNQLLLRNYTKCTTGISQCGHALAFMHDMRSILHTGYAVFPGRSLSLDMNPAYNLYHRRPHSARCTLTFLRSNEIVQTFASYLISLTIHVEFKSRLQFNQFKMLFKNLTNLRSLLLTNARFPNASTIPEDNLNSVNLCVLSKLENLKLIGCDDDVSTAFISACAGSVEYLYILSNSRSIKFWNTISDLPFDKLKHLSVQSQDKTYADLPFNLLTLPAPLLNGIRIEYSPGANDIFLPFRLKNIKTLQLVGHDRELGTMEVAKLTQNRKLNELCLPVWMLRHPWLSEYLNKFINLKRLVFWCTNENHVILKPTHVIPLDRIKMAKALSKHVSTKLIYLKHGATTYNVDTGDVDLDGREFLERHAN